MKDYSTNIHLSRVESEVSPKYVIRVIQMSGTIQTTWQLKSNAHDLPMR